MVLRGIGRGAINSTKLGKHFKINDQEINRTRIIYPVLIKLDSKPKIKPDWEHSEYIWISPREMKLYKTVQIVQDGLERVLK